MGHSHFMESLMISTEFKNTEQSTCNDEIRNRVRASYYMESNQSNGQTYGIVIHHLTAGYFFLCLMQMQTNSP